MKRCLIRNPDRLELCSCWWRATVWLSQPCRVGIWIIQDDCMVYADIDHRVTLFVCNRFIDLFQSIEPLHNLSEDGSLAIKEVCVFSQSDDELGRCQARIWVGWAGSRGHADCASLKMLQLRVEESRKCSLGWVA